MAVAALAGRALVGLLDVVLPPRCLACGAAVESQGRLCAGCWRALTFLAPPQCRLCGYPLPHALPDAPLCGACAIEPPAFDRARAALRYDEGARGLILAFKHADRTDNAPAFGRWLARAGAEAARRGRPDRAGPAASLAPAPARLQPGRGSRPRARPRG